MIYYISKNSDEKKIVTNGYWLSLPSISSFNRLMFDDYHYKIGDKIFREPTAEAKVNFEKELIWQNLQKS